MVPVVGAARAARRAVLARGRDPSDPHTAEILRGALEILLVSRCVLLADIETAIWRSRGSWAGILRSDDAPARRTSHGPPTGSSSSIAAISAADVNGLSSTFIAPMR